MQDLAEAIGLNQSSVSRLVTRLEQAGLTDRVLCADDRRGIHPMITEHWRERGCSPPHWTRPPRTRPWPTGRPAPPGDDALRADDPAPAVVGHRVAVRRRGAGTGVGAGVAEGSAGATGACPTQRDRLGEAGRGGSGRERTRPCGAQATDVHRRRRARGDRVGRDGDLRRPRRPRLAGADQGQDGGEDRRGVRRSACPPRGCRRTPGEHHTSPIGGHLGACSPICRTRRRKSALSRPLRAGFG
ncbi:MarR family transcriptional regulator [Actinokineospora auranticolor]|uniref:MarR family transcriptional regulator n=1 Tax=Actinokineospora auranticolor TaxID=155976 RepID=UPI0035A8604C